MRLLTVAATVIVSLAACGWARHAAEENTGLGAITAITVRNTSCNGACPEYAMHFTADGRAMYVGGRYAPLQGKFSGTIDFPSLAAWVDTQHPELLQDRYPVGIDSQVVTLTIDRGARRKTVVAERGLGPGMPLRLDGILLALDGVTTRIRWRRVDAMTSFMGTFSGPVAAGTGRATAVMIQQSQDGPLLAYSPTLRCGNAAPSLTPVAGDLRLRCATRSSTLHATADGFLANGDALPAGTYRRIDPRGATVLWGTPLDPRLTE
jgi:hypothetical protein